jgi:hypothetical protein
MRDPALFTALAILIGWGVLMVSALAIVIAYEVRDRRALRRRDGSRGSRSPSDRRTA